MTSRITPKTFKEIPPTKVDKTDIKTETTSLALYTEPTERITGLTALSNGTFVIVSTALTREGNYNKLLFFDNQSSKSKKNIRIKKI